MQKMFSLKHKILVQMIIFVWDMLHAFDQLYD